jgi:hypothetical protein
MAIVLIVRSLTGTTVELFDVLFLLFGALALGGRLPTEAPVAVGLRAPRAAALDERVVRA